MHAIRLPQSLRLIGRGAFAGCVGLSSVTFDDSLNYLDPSNTLAIDAYAFAGVLADERGGSSGSQLGVMFYISGLEERFIDDFEFMTSLSVVTLPPRTKQVSTYAFQDCVNLTNVAIPSTALVSDPAFGNTGCSQYDLNGSL